jgi:hypothetical protein
MDNEIIQYEAEKIELPVLESKINGIGSSVMTSYREDRDEAEKIKTLIYQEIENIKTEYESDLKRYEDQYSMIWEEEDPEVRRELLKYCKRPRRPAVTYLIAELNRALEITVSSSDNIVKLVDILAKIKIAKSKSDEFDEINMSSKRSNILKEFKETK